jgi:hypothetical protein
VLGVDVNPEVGELVEHAGTLIVGGHDPDFEPLWRDPAKSAQSRIPSGSVNHPSIPDTMGSVDEAESQIMITLISGWLLRQPSLQSAGEDLS